MEDYRIEETTTELVDPEQNTEVTTENSTSKSNNGLGYVLLGALGTLATIGIAKGIKAVTKKINIKRKKKDEDTIVTTFENKDRDSEEFDDEEVNESED